MTGFNETPTPLIQPSIPDDTKLQPNNGNPSGEGFLTIILIALGTLGLYHVGSTYEQPSVYNSNISSSSPQTKLNHSPNELNEIKKYPKSIINKTYTDQLKVSGKPKVSESLAFTIDSYDNHVSYIIDLGNGDILEPNKKTVYYDYPVSGSYLVELIATYKGQETLLFSDFVDIYNTVELVSEASVKL